MSETVLSGLTIVAALGSGLMAGFFFAFSAVIMTALGRLPAARGIAAMQSINVVVINPWFLGIFLGTVVAGVVVAVASFSSWTDPDANLRLAGGVLYLVGAIGVSMAFNVPRNDALAAVDAESPEAASRWATYVPQWTAWNTVRMVAALAAAALFIAALVVA